jgi:hypothetical protein
MYMFIAYTLFDTLAAHFAEGLGGISIDLSGKYFLIAFGMSHLTKKKTAAWAAARILRI